jgi:Rps23 Pro-64 3,4-dihydroxylase Tpa1-like proline 4-hydroxylase
MLIIKTDVFSSDLISSIRAFSNTQDTVRTNHRNWSSDVVGMSGPIYLVDLSEELIFRIFTQLVKSFPEFNFSDLRAKATHTFGGRFSFIPWHTDENHILSVTIYLNEVWDRDWGGFFLYENKDGLGAILPRFNTAVGFKCPMTHCTVMPTINAPLRESIQVFFDPKYEN